MRAEQLAEQVKQLKNTLNDMEGQLSDGEIPRSALEDFKTAVDHVRLTIWAILSAQEAEPSQVTAAVSRFRLIRTVEMCQQVVKDINANEITTGTPELPLFHGTLKQTLDRINRLQMAAR